jgi:hypothetical protein
MQLPVAVEQERVPRRRIFTGVSSGKVRRYSAVRRASVKTFSFSSPLTNFTASPQLLREYPRRRLAIRRILRCRFLSLCPS